MSTQHVLTAGLVLAALLGGGATAATLEANRYKNSEGVEVLTSRGSLAALAPPVALEAEKARALPSSPPAPSSRSAPSARRASAPPTAAAAPGNRQINADVQAERDRDRTTILTQELVAEGRALEVKRQTLRSPRSAFDMTAEQQQALREQVARHEGNVLALNREIMRAKLSTSAAGSLNARADAAQR